MFVFPGIGLGVILCKAAKVSDEMVRNILAVIDTILKQIQIYEAGASLSTALTQSEIDAGSLYPEIERIREVSVVVARGVIRAAQKERLDRQLAIREVDDETLDEYIRERMYDPWKEENGLVEEVVGMVRSLKA